MVLCLLNTVHNFWKIIPLIQNQQLIDYQYIKKSLINFSESHRLLGNQKLNISQSDLHSHNLDMLPCRTVGMSENLEGTS